MPMDMLEQKKAAIKNFLAEYRSVTGLGNRVAAISTEALQALERASEATSVEEYRRFIELVGGERGVLEVAYNLSVYLD